MNSDFHYEELSCTDDNIRLDSFIAAETSFSRSRVAKLIQDGHVFVNNEKVNKSYRLSKGDSICFRIPEDTDINTKPEDLPLNIIYEDQHIVVINKPQGMVVHPAPGNYTGTLVNALLYHCKDSLSGINGKLRPGIVHRIDKDTSGLLVVAKSDLAHIPLTEMFKTHKFRRTYHAILYGCPKNDIGTVELAIGRSKKDRKKMAFYPLNTPHTKNALTHYRVLERFRGYSYVELQLETGRTHQIRVHMLSLSCPVLADPLYAAGRKTFGLQGQCLHAKTISFAHPITGKKMEFDSPLPDYFQNTLETLRKL